MSDSSFVYELKIVGFRETFYQKVYQFVRITFFILLCLNVSWYLLMVFLDFPMLDRYANGIIGVTVALMVIMVSMFFIKKPFSIIGKIVFYETGIHLSTLNRFIQFNDLSKMVIKYHGHKGEKEHNVGSGVEFKAGVGNTMQIFEGKNRIGIHFLVDSARAADELSSLMIKLSRSHGNVVYYQEGKRVI